LLPLTLVKEFGRGEGILVLARGNWKICSNERESALQTVRYIGRDDRHMHSGCKWTVWTLNRVWTLKLGSASHQ
jgi:hypothetical protein